MEVELLFHVSAVVSGVSLHLLLTSTFKTLAMLAPSFGWQSRPPSQWWFWLHTFSGMSGFHNTAKTLPWCRLIFGSPSLAAGSVACGYEILKAAVQWFRKKASDNDQGVA